MKNIILLFGVFFILFSSCKQENYSIVGTWELKQVKNNVKVSNKKAYKKALENLMKTTTIHFEENNKFYGTIWGDTSYGHWYMINDSLTIIDKMTHKKFSVKIEKLTAETLILKEKDDSIIVELIFKREGLPSTNE